VGAYTFDKIGPLARSAEDCRLILQAIAGPDPDDASAADEPVRLDGGRLDPSRIRGALIPLDFKKTKGAEPEVKSRFDQAVADLRGAGLTLTETSLPEFPASEMASVLINAEALSTFENFYKSGGVWDLKDPYAPYQQEITRALNGADLVKAWRMRAVLQEKMTDFYARYDVIVTPNFMSVAPSIHEDLNKSLPYADPVGAVGNSCGLPSIALPCGFGKGGMPVGFQIMGSPFEESTLLGLGALYQSRTRFHRERPPLNA